MADEENNEPKKKGLILRILIFLVAGLVLIGWGWAVVMFCLGVTSQIRLMKSNLSLKRKWLKLTLNAKLNKRPH